MGKGVEKKKKGRPSLLDIQKRNLKLQKQQQQQQKRNPNPNPYSNPNFGNHIVSNPNSNSDPNRRSTRRNRSPDGIAAETKRIQVGEADDEEDDEDLKGKRTEKKLKLVLRLPSNQQDQRSSENFPHLNSDSLGFDSNGETKLQKINAVGDGSAHSDGEKGKKHEPPSKATDKHLATTMESGPTAPLPDKKLLTFVLDRLQKKDTYRVFSEPVDPKELPDYHDIVKHPMDFGTVRKKLNGGAYTNLEQFETDVFLICSNAMQYNSPDTIYFRQARSIQELAKKNFENLRQDSDDNEPEHKIVRRGRPPTKNLKKPLGKATIERAGSEFSSDATPAMAGDNAIWSNSYDLRKGPLADKYGFFGTSQRAFYGSGNSEAHTGWSTEHKSERNGEFPGYILKGSSMRFGKKQFIMDENRRNTYKHSHPSVIGCEPSVLTTFDGEKKQLMAVGLHMEYGYARSLARFSAKLGPIAWKIASKKIEKALPAGMMFGHGWVVENDAPPPLLMPSPSQPLPPQQPFPLPRISLSTSTTPLIVESKGEKLPVKQETSNNSVSDGLLSRTLAPCTVASSTNTPTEPTTERVETARGLNNNEMNSSGGGIRPPFQIHQHSVLVDPAMNGSSGRFGFNLSSQLVPARPSGSVSPEASTHFRKLDMVAHNKFVHSMPSNCLESENPNPSQNSCTINSDASLQNSSHEAYAGSSIVGLRQQPSWHGLLRQNKSDSVPPDLNIRFQTSGSPNSSMAHPDLVLQL